MTKNPDMTGVPSDVSASGREDAIKETAHALATQHKQGELDFIKGKREALQKLPQTPEQQKELFRLMVRERAASLIDTKALAGKLIDDHTREEPMRTAMARILAEGKSHIIVKRVRVLAQPLQPSKENNTDSRPPLLGRI